MAAPLAFICPVLGALSTATTSIQQEIAKFRADRGIGALKSKAATGNALGAALQFGMFNAFGGAEFARVKGRMDAKKAKKRGPPLSDFHDPGALLFPGLLTQPFHEPSDDSRIADAAALLEHFYPVIRDEAMALSKEKQLPQYRDHDDTLLHDGDGDWRVHYLELEGKDTSAAREQTPKTAAIVDAINRRSSHSFLSVLEPGTHILPHCGPSNYRLRLQLGLQVPEGCSIRVGDQTRSWEEGKVLCLDDAFEHEVWNTSDERRVILIVDIFHPDFSDKEVEWMEETRRARFAKMARG